MLDLRNYFSQNNFTTALNKVILDFLRERDETNDYLLTYYLFVNDDYETNTKLIFF